MFDYVIVGAGTAGCVLAARLTQDPTVQVLLVEAGPPDRSHAIRTPLLYPKLYQSAHDWNYWTQAQPAMGNRHLYWPRGKTLGGSGSINGMVHMDPCEEDLAHWNVPGWTAKELLGLRSQLQSHAAPPAELNPLSEAFLAACQAAGLPRTSQLDDASQPEAAPFRLNIRKGRRWSAADAYLRPALARGNLTVWTNVHVRKLLFEGNRAAGLEFTQGGDPQTVAVAREILLCAGSVGSPQLLLLSGVGPKADLEALQIPVVAPLNGVGRNLQDHVAAPIAYFCLEPISVSGAITTSNEWYYRLLGKGPLSSNGAEAGAVIRTNPDLPACDVEIVFASGHYVDHGFASPGGHGFSLIPTLLTPLSRGQIKLQSANPDDPPSIDPAYLSDPADVDTLSKGVLFARRLLDQPPMVQYRGAPVPGRVLEPAEHIKQWGQTLYHPVGTCKMGTDEQAVVDAHLRVRGVTGLRVADGSVIPRIPRSHTNVTTMLIAERAAQLLRG